MQGAGAGACVQRGGSTQAVLSVTAQETFLFSLLFPSFLEEKHINWILAYLGKLNTVVGTLDPPWDAPCIIN